MIKTSCFLKSVEDFSLTVEGMLYGSGYHEVGKSLFISFSINFCKLDVIPPDVYT